MGDLLPMKEIHSQGYLLQVESGHVGCEFSEDLRKDWSFDELHRKADEALRLEGGERPEEEAVVEPRQDPRLPEDVRDLFLSPRSHPLEPVWLALDLNCKLVPLLDDKAGVIYTVTQVHGSD